MKSIFIWSIFLVPVDVVQGIQYKHNGQKEKGKRLNSQEKMESFSVLSSPCVTHNITLRKSKENTVIYIILKNNSVSVNT